jgi:hypothetical protein
MPCGSSDTNHGHAERQFLGVVFRFDADVRVGTGISTNVVFDRMGVPKAVERAMQIAKLVGCKLPARSARQIRSCRGWIVAIIISVMLGR